MQGTRPKEKLARREIEAFLGTELEIRNECLAYRNGDYEEFLYTLAEDGEDGWSFWIKEDDTTSYVHHDMNIEWYGTSWISDGEDEQ